ncbi:tail fiber assembly protein [Comamonas sp.]|uniref:tail fiber assembly protein n=1 Tax=Comamonas sp. TaxID=34028 RepID=UPI00289C3025|nr:tail fiber assembly protein [Comamonas sp.]
MKSYYVVDDEGYMVASGHYNHDAELKFYRAQHGARLRLGTPRSFVPADAPSMTHRWHVERCCWDFPAVDIASEWEKVRYQRDKLLAACDWRILPDAPTSQEERQAWLEYRAALRDITEQPNVTAICWPMQPIQR